MIKMFGAATCLLAAAASSLLACKMAATLTYNDERGEDEPALVVFATGVTVAVTSLTALLPAWGLAAGLTVGLLPMALFVPSWLKYYYGLPFLGDVLELTCSTLVLAACTMLSGTGFLSILFIIGTVAVTAMALEELVSCMQDVRADIKY